MHFLIRICLWGALSGAMVQGAYAANLDLRQAVIVVRAGDLPAAERIAPVILSEEVQRRTGLAWHITESVTDAMAPQILLVNSASLPLWKTEIPVELISQPILKHSEAYCIAVVPQSESQPPRVWVVGADARGVMFGVGQLLRRLDLLLDSAAIAADFHCETAPDRAIRGHQIGYRPRANSWDAWTVEQFDQYFRDMVVFGANCMENIPFQDDDPALLMKMTREEMNLHFAQLCARYDLDHWLWVPVEFSVQDKTKADEFLQQQEKFYQACPRLDAIFVPGGDPGDNAAKPLLPYLQRMAEAAPKYHPQAKVWMSLQGFKKEDIDDCFSYLTEQQPDWFGGAVMGPSSPAMDLTRSRLPQQYPLRWYPDITHNVRCQYPVPWLDPVWGLTIGREGVNPRPHDYTAIYHIDYRYTDGFLSYSDGIHDDFNKNLWSQLAWDPDQSIHDMTGDYARYFFRSDLGELGASALLGLEANLRGPAISNGAVEGTLRQWQAIESRYPNYAANWRLQMHLFRAYYDSYIQQRLQYESKLERQALEHLQQRSADDPIASRIAQAIEVLNRAETAPVRQDLLHKIEAMADSLFATIGYQTSVPKYQASGFERGCMMDYVNYPLNNRWWLEDELNRVTLIESPAAQQKRLQQLVQWENPGAGGYYDIIGNVGRSPRMIKLQNAGDAMRHYYDIPMPTQRNIAPQRNNLRMAWHVYHDAIPTLTYDALDPQGSYRVKLFAQRESPLMIDGTPAKRIRTGPTYDQVTEQEFEVPASANADGNIELSWGVLDERHLNWRQKHYVTDIWILRDEALGQP